MPSKWKFVYNYGSAAKPKWFFKRARGHRKVAVDPSAPDFEITYGKLLAGLKPKPKPSKPNTAKTFGQGIIDYYASGEFQRWAKSRQTNVKAILNSCRDEPTNDERYKIYDAVPLHQMTLQGLAVLRNRKLPHLPGAAHNRVILLRPLFRWLKKYGYLADNNPAEDLDNFKYDPLRVHTWTLDEIQQYRDYWAIGTKQRLGFELMWHGCPRVDVVLVGPDNLVLRDGRHHLEYRRQKTGEAGSIEAESDLLACLDDYQPTRISPKGTVVPMVANHWLVSGAGRLTYESKHFGRLFKKWAKAAGLPSRCTPHGLRRACACRLVGYGYTESELSAAMAWKVGSREAATYLRAANKVTLSVNAAARRHRRTKGE